MPELPEVETIVQDLNRKVLGRTFLDIWTDWPRMIRKPKNLKEFKKEILGRKIKAVKRRGKLILIQLSGDKTLLLHQKLTGHLLVGKWKFKKGKWLAPPGPLSERINTYLHLVFTLDNGLMLAFSDLRKFGFVELWSNQELKSAPRLKELGPDPLEEHFTFEKFKERISKIRGKIKQVLMNQEVIAGIGNIYSDEILWQAKIHPLKRIEELSSKELERIYRAMREILRKAIKLRGESISDFRDTAGRKGQFDRVRKVYRREGEKCSLCGTIIEKIKVGGRSSYYCPQCQTLASKG